RAKESELSDSDQDDNDEDDERMFGEENAYSFGLDDSEVNRIVLQGHVQEMTEKFAEKIKNIQNERLEKGINICMVTRAKSRAAKQGENITNESENEVISNPTVIEELENVEENEQIPVESQVDISITTEDEEPTDEP